MECGLFRNSCTKVTHRFRLTCLRTARKREQDQRRKQDGRRAASSESQEGLRARRRNAGAGWVGGRCECARSSPPRQTSGRSGDETKPAGSAAGPVAPCHHAWVSFYSVAVPQPGLAARGGRVDRDVCHQKSQPPLEQVWLCARNCRACRSRLPTGGGPKVFRWKTRAEPPRTISSVAAAYLKLGVEATPPRPASRS